MFVVDCPGHGARTVLSVHAVTGISHPAPGAIEVELRCWCGHTVRHCTGRAAASVAAGV